uniref:Uncharacterized protein n=1 Tax=Arundo donax TaxID=35708 RepID=A0A0A9FSP9_ARUDO
MLKSLRHSEKSSESMSNSAFKESDAAGSEARRRPLPALLSRRGFFLEPLPAGVCARAGAVAGALVLGPRAEGPRRPPPSSSPEEEERTTTGGRFSIGGGAGERPYQLTRA